MDFALGLIVGLLINILWVGWKIYFKIE